MPRGTRLAPSHLGVQSSSSTLGAEIPQNKIFQKTKCPKWPSCDLRPIMSLLGCVPHRADYDCHPGSVDQRRWTGGGFTGDSGARARRAHPDPGPPRPVSSGV